MGILSSMYTGVTGLTGQGEALGIYGDNIANANTTGFKVSRPEFSDVVAKSLKGISGGNQIGRGTKLSAVNPIFSQGSLLQTESVTDLAIQGDGMFVVDGNEGRGFSRAGAFHFDKDGNLINADNYKIQGFQADESGKITSKLGSIAVGRTVIEAKPSKEVQMFMNLDLRAKKEMVFDPKSPEKTSHFATGVTVYDGAGTPRTVTAYFNKKDDGVWEWRAMSKGEEVPGGKPGEMVEQAKGTLTFDADGKLMEQKTDKSAFNFIGSTKKDQEIKFNFGKDKKNGGDGLAVTQFGTASEAYKTLQDGYTAGTIAGLSFNDDGILSAVYTNGESMNVAQVALAKFENPEGLFKMGKNIFRESRNSGQATVGAPQTGGRGQILAKTLESSTTDIATEFINLMSAQRNFQANSKVISASDEMMQEVLNIKRN
ncbi:MAG: flagellar hook protein FlgE [Cryobacterium sp.]|nr:flagellar hook protein FlgE [Oligoflexia bacterium]